MSQATQSTVHSRPDSFSQDVSAAIFGLVLALFTIWFLQFLGLPFASSLVAGFLIQAASFGVFFSSGTKRSPDWA
jgi:hypothetical protein